MSASLATGPRNFIITDSTSVVNEDDNTLATVTACTDSMQPDAGLNISEVDIVDTHYTIATDADATANTTAVVTATEAPTAEEEFQFITAQNFEEVMGQEQEVAVISVVVPMDVSDTSSNEANANIATLSAINGNADLAQQMANGQLTVLQTQTADGEEAVPQYITVTDAQKQLHHRLQAINGNLNHRLEKCYCKLHHHYQQRQHQHQQQLLQQNYQYSQNNGHYYQQQQQQSLNQQQLPVAAVSVTILQPTHHSHHSNHQQNNSEQPVAHHLHHHHHHHHHHRTFVANATNFSSICSPSCPASLSPSPSSSTVSQNSQSHSTNPAMYRRQNNLNYCGVSAQDGGQNYQVQYVDTDLYHSNSSQTQMSYPFCPVGDYQTNGQTYYAATTCSSYAATTALNTTVTNSSTLPFLVPVDENLLLNSSSQSQSRDSPNSLTDVAYLHETQRTPQTPTSTSTANSINGSNIGLGISNGNIGRGDLLLENEQGHCGSKIASATIKWLSNNYETADGVSLPRSTLYNHYIQHCQESKLEPVNAASFGKLIRSVFSGLRTRRLGTRGNSKYHYYGIRIKPDSILNHMMEEKQCYNNAHKDDAGNLEITAGAGNMTDTHILNAHDCQHSTINLPNYITNKHNRKSNFKPETFETCIQFLGDGTNAIPAFPPIDLGNAFNNELSCEDVEIFRSMYREHCENFLDAILNLEFHTVEFLWREFWRDNTDHNCLDECTSEEKYFSKSKLYMLCHCSGVQEFVREVDYQFYQNLVDVIIPDVLRSIPNALTQAIRNFAKNMEVWSCEAMMGVPEPMLQIKSAAVSAFCQTLRRYTSLNHLAQAARAVLQNSTQIAQMLSDLNRVDFHNVQEQASWVCQCDAAVVQRLENDFKTALQQQSSLEQWASWLQLVVDTSLQEYRDKQNYAKAARHFLLKWSFYSSLVIRDLTLRSASSFGSFHLIRLLYDEYMFYLVEHKIAEAQQKTAIAVICDRTKKNSEYDINYQLEFITSENIASEPINKRMKNE